MKYSIIHRKPFFFQCVLNTFSHNDIQLGIEEKKKKGRQMTSAERKWTISEEKRRHELIKRNGKGQKSKNRDFRKFQKTS